MKNEGIYTPVDVALIRSGDTPRKYVSFYPSEASCVVDGKVIGSCLRKQYFLWNATGATEPKSYKMMLSATLGNACEKFFLDGYQKNRLLRSRGAPFKATVMGLNISGKTDGITKDGKLIEVKSAYGTAFYNAVNTAPKNEHLCQILLYMSILGFHDCILPYMCRDNTNKRAGYVITKAEIEAKGIYTSKILQRWVQLRGYVSRKEIPPCDFDAKSWQCGYCSFRGRCHEDEPIKEKKAAITKATRRRKREDAPDSGTDSAHNPTSQKEA